MEPQLNEWDRNSQIRTATLRLGQHFEDQDLEIYLNWDRSLEIESATCRLDRVGGLRCGRIVVWGELQFGVAVLGSCSIGELRLEGNALWESCDVGELRCGGVAV